MMNDGTVKLVPCPSCKGAASPSCKQCGGSGLVPSGPTPQK